MPTYRDVLICSRRWRIRSRRNASTCVGHNGGAFVGNAASGCANGKVRHARRGHATGADGQSQPLGIVSASGVSLPSAGTNPDFLFPIPYPLSPLLCS